MALVDQAGWNQTPADWARFLSASPGGCFAAVVDDQLIGTAATIAYGGRLAWIGMVIVDREYRERGIGRRLLQAACDAVDRGGIPCAKLDATPAGEPLYATHGFVREQRLERWELTRPAESGARSGSVAMSTISDETIQLDATLFGADRRALIRSLRDESPDLAMELRDASRVRGYALGRRGLRADHLGPWMARDEGTAAHILDAFLARSSRPRVFVDCLVEHPYARRILDARGFRPSRPLVRMSRGPSPPANDGDLLAVVGPEFG
jgi:GNAT superfamily N-acetyltransferase